MARAPAKKAARSARKPPKTAAVEKRAAKKSGGETAARRPVAERLREAVTWLERHGTKKIRDGMARYGIDTADETLGIALGDIRKLAKQLGPDHELAAALWKTRIYEARLLAAFVGEPAKLTARQMDEWVRECDNWATCDTLCFALFDRTPLAFDRIVPWARSQDEFVRRAAFALLACLALHGRGDADAPYLRFLPLVETASTDERNFVKKAVSWALRAVGGRSVVLHAEALTMARRLAGSKSATARWIGKDAVRGLQSPATLGRLAKKKG